MLMQPWNPALIKHRSPLHEPATPAGPPGMHLQSCGGQVLARAFIKGGCQLAAAW
jgi:hypothetical protein